MHGRARPPKGFQPSPEQLEKLQKKTHLLKSATTEVLTRVQRREYDVKTLSTSAKLLALNPEIYTVWNYRKDAIQQYFRLEGTTEEIKREFCSQELQLVAEAISSNPKSYAAWYHRRWLVDLEYCELKAEFRFVERKLEEDSRNFHAWNYRLFLVQKSGRAPEVELKFSQEKIEQNFSNFSAWHHRSRCLEGMHQPVTSISLTELLQDEPTAPEPVQETRVPLETLEAEFQTVHSAFVTDPDDSSAWIYYRWLMTHFVHLTDDEASQRVLEKELDFFQSDLMNLDSHSKWILLTYALLLEVRDRGGGYMSSQAKEVYGRLCEVDPMRKGFYKDVQNGEASILMTVT